MEVVREVRWYQRPFHEYLVKGGKRAIEIAHRRWGKDEITLMATCELAHRRPATYWHCLPEYAQARKALWNAVNPHTGRRRVDEAFPPQVRESTQEHEMFIRLKCGSTWQLIGSDRYDATVGSGPAGIVYSEWSRANPSAWGYHRPMLVENDGWAAFITTPFGHNHAESLLRMAQRSPNWFAEVSTVEDTGALTQAQLGEALEEYIAIYGVDAGTALYEQEYLCSFNAAILGAFYAREMANVRKEGRIRDFEPTDAPIHRAWDIGVKDDTSIWWFQIQGGNVLVLDCYTNHGAGVGHYVEAIKERDWPLQGAKDYVPHDAKVREWGTGRTRIEAMRAEGLNPQLVPNATKLDGINAARQTLPHCIFHSRTEEVGVAALEQYRREWDDERKTFAASEYRDWTTHLADAFRYLSLAWREIKQKPVEKQERPKGATELPIIELMKRQQRKKKWYKQ